VKHSILQARERKGKKKKKALETTGEKKGEGPRTFYASFGLGVEGGGGGKVNRLDPPRGGMKAGSVEFELTGKKDTSGASGHAQKKKGEENAFSGRAPREEKKKKKGHSPTQDGKRKGGRVFSSVNLCREKVRVHASVDQQKKKEGGKQMTGSFKAGRDRKGG